MEENKPLFDLNVDFQTSAEGIETSRWAKLLGIMMLVIPGLLLLFLFAGWNRVGYLFSADLSTAGSDSSGFMIVLLIALLVVVAILAVLAFYLIRGSKRIYTGLRLKDQSSFNGGLADIKSFFIIYGVLSMLALVFSLISFIR